MNQAQVASVLEEIATLLELKGENQFRCRAYHNAARAIAQLESNLEELVANEQLDTVEGIGDALKEKITALVTTGKLQYYDDLRAKFPEGVVKMLKIPGLGPKKVKALFEELELDTLDKLRASCQSGEVAKLKGFGTKTQQKILDGLDFLEQSADRVRIDQALPIALEMLEELRKLPGVIRSELCGSLRRRKETIKDIDILISSDDPKPIMDHFVKLPNVVAVVAHGDTKSSVKTAAGDSQRVLINTDLRIVNDAQFPFALHYFTGSKEHNIVMRSRAQERGLKLNEYELAGSGKSVKCKDEADIFKSLGMDYVPPELREKTGEFEAAEKHKLPSLIELNDIQGVFHCHTDWSDGSNTLEQMATAAKKLGLKYLGIGDHSQSLTVANGLSPARVKKQQAEIDSLNKKLKGFRVFKGIECDILPDGSLDYEDDVLETFEYVVASVHSHFNQTEEEMTDRIIKAIGNPHVTMLGHATGRLLLKRDGYRVNLEKVLNAAAEHETMVEINAHPMRLDLDWVHCKRAKHLGVMLVINPDAHSISDIAYYSYGVDVARRGWLEKGDIFNTKTTAQIEKAFAGRKK